MRPDAPTTEPDPMPVTPAPQLTTAWRGAAWLLVAGAAALAVGGFVNSFTAVKEAVEPSFGGLAWTIPVLIDVGVAVFSGIDLLFTRLGMRLRWLRLVPWSLIAATIWLNVAHETTSVAIVAHAAPPVLWVVTVELASHAMRMLGGVDDHVPARRRAGGGMDRIRASRWLLAPWSTLVIRRWMVLQEERSYEQAVTRWWERKQAKWALQDTYGALTWRFRAPRRARGLYRWGHLSTATVGGPAARVQPLKVHELADIPTTTDEVDAAADSPPQPDTARVRARRRPPRGRARATFAEFDAVAAELRAQGQPVNRTQVMRRLRSQGLSLANDRADKYLAQLEHHRAA